MLPQKNSVYFQNPSNGFPSESDFSCMMAVVQCLKKLVIQFSSNFRSHLSPQDCVQCLFDISLSPRAVSSTASACVTVTGSGRVRSVSRTTSASIRRAVCPTWRESVEAVWWTAVWSAVTPTLTWSASASGKLQDSTYFDMVSESFR